MKYIRCSVQSVQFTLLYFSASAWIGRFSLPTSLTSFYCIFICCIQHRSRHDLPQNLLLYKQWFTYKFQEKKSNIHWIYRKNCKMICSKGTVSVNSQIKLYVCGTSSLLEPQKRTFFLLTWDLVNIVLYKKILYSNSIQKKKKNGVL